MRKTLFAMLGLVALGLWALPALAAVSVDPLKNPPKVSEPIPLENRAGFEKRFGGSTQGTLSGTLIKQSQATTTWFLYPGACADRQNGPAPGLGTWAAKTSIVADSLNGASPPYVAGTPGPYGLLDQSLTEILWHVSDNATCTPGTNCPPALAGTRALWCGKFDVNYISSKYGYPNLTEQILYFDTGAHALPYNLVLTYAVNCEQNYDFMYAIGGGDNLRDPVGNTRPTIDHVIADGASGNVKLLTAWTGSVNPGVANATGGNTTGGTVRITGAGDSPETPVVGASFQIEAQHRAIYIVFKSDCLFSTEDGSWKNGHGQQVDNVSVSDNGALYTDEAAPLSGGLPIPDTGPGVTPGGGIVLKGTSSAPTISARVGAGIGTLWTLVQGNNLPTPDVCTPKNTTSDLIFEGGNNSTFHTIANQFNSIVVCTFPIPTGVASVLALWDEYLDLPRFQGYVQYSEFRIFKSGGWGNWNNTSPGGGVVTGARQSWGTDGDELAEATQADSVQIRYNIQCIPFFAADHNNCGDVLYGVLYDNFRLELTTGVPAPIFGVFVGSIGQSMFVDGTLPSPGNCSAATVAAGQCWPGVRGSDIPPPATGSLANIHDNFNSPLGDSITLGVVTGLRKNGKGINWLHGFDKGVNFGLTIAHTNPNDNRHGGVGGFNPDFDVPRIIFRMFDPTSKTWSPFDSSELDANNVSIAAGDTILVDNEFRVNWPPRDKVAAGAALPGGFSINGKTLYSQLNFMPRGSRIQYYWKGVDIAGGTSYQFASDALAREVDNLPTLPGGTNVAPDIIEFDVLPSVYALGAPGSQLASSTNTPILDLDGSYTRWNFGAHATVQALRAMGVRFDRYRTLQGQEEGGHIGGHEFAGTRAGRLSNYFPNMDEYPIAQLLADSYRIMIESSHTATSVVDEESDAKLIKTWWLTETAPTGQSSGDRCIFASGDDYHSALLAVGGVPHPNENNLATDVFGVASAANQWNGGGTNQFPVIRDLFADPAAGPALGTPGAFAYVADGGCPAPNRFDALTKVGAGTQNSALYPVFGGVTNVAGVSNSIAAFTGGAQDHDRNKALSYGFSIQFIRQGGANLVDTRAQVLYKFITSCRGPRTTTDTAQCWPCPTGVPPFPSPGLASMSPASQENKYGNWNTQTGYNQGTYGPLYKCQDHTKVLSGVGPGEGAPSFANRLDRNFPNPFNPETAIRFSSARAGRVDVRIFNVAGRLVQTISKNVTQGVNEVRWNGKSSDGANLASGVYFVKVKYPDGSESPNGLKVAIVR